MFSETTTFKVVRILLRRVSRVFRSKPMTIEFPYVARPSPQGARLSIRNDFSECTGCLLCERKCPVSCIKIAAEPYPMRERVPKTSKGLLFENQVTGFEIDYRSCVNCGLCVDVCPTGSLSFEKKITVPRTQEKLLVTDLVHRPRSVRREQGYED